MQFEVNGTSIFLTMSKEIWGNVTDLSIVKYATQINEIKAKIHSTKQDASSRIEYYNVMEDLWFELDHYQNLEMKNSEDAVMFLKFIARERIFEFLARLNMECDQVLVQVLRKESLTSLNNVFSIVRAEEVIRSIMLDILASEGSTFAILSSKSSLIPSTILVEMYLSVQVIGITFNVFIARNKGKQRRCVGS